MKIYILGHYCKTCDAVEELVRNVVEEIEIAATITRIVKDMDILKFGVCLTPAVVVDNEMKVMGRKPRKEVVLSWVMAERLMTDKSTDTKCIQIGHSALINKPIKSTLTKESV